MNTPAESSNRNSRVLIVDENSEFMHRASEFLQNTDRVIWVAASVLSACGIAMFWIARGQQHSNEFPRLGLTINGEKYEQNN